MRSIAPPPPVSLPPTPKSDIDNSTFTIFGQGGGGKTRNAKLMGSLLNLDRVFVPEISVL